jgi:hypothetical protein
VSTCLSKSLWDLCEQWSGWDVDWIKIEGLSKLIHQTMSQPPQKPIRMRLTPEGVAGYEELESVEDYQKRMSREAQDRGASRTAKPRSGPRKSSGDARGSRGPRSSRGGRGSRRGGRSGPRPSGRKR